MGAEFHANLTRGGQIDRYDEASSRFSQFDKAPKITEISWNVVILDIGFV